MDVSTALRRTLNLLAEAPAAYLTTIDHDGWPQTRAMLNLRNKTKYSALTPIFSCHSEDLLLYFTTNTSSAKIAQIKQNQKASVYYCNPSGWQGLMLGGEITIISDTWIKRDLWQEEWTMYYPGGREDPDYAIISLTPKVAKYYESLDFCAWNPSIES